MSLAQGNNTPTRPRIEPGSPDPESDALTIRPVRSPISKFDIGVKWGKSRVRIKMIKMDNFQYCSIKSCFGCVLESLGEAILIHIQNIWFYGELCMIIKGKTLIFCENFMSTETLS